MSTDAVHLDEVWAFCSARLDDDEEMARATSDSEIDEQLGWAEVHVGQAQEHIARHLPSRVIADVMFKRGLLAEHQPVLAAAAQDDQVTPMLVCRIDGDDCPFTRGLAGLYAGHPGYRETWRP